MTDFSAPTVDRIRRRLHYRLDGSPGARCRAVGPEGRPTHYTAPRAAVAAVALRWCALGYRDVQIALAPRREVGPARFRPYPATQDEAIQAVRELAARRAVGAGQWRRFLRRLDTQSVIVPSDPNPPNEGDQPPMDHLTEFCRAYLRDARDEGAVAGQPELI